MFPSCSLIFFGSYRWNRSTGSRNKTASGPRSDGTDGKPTILKCRLESITNSPPSALLMRRSCTRSASAKPKPKPSRLSCAAQSASKPAPPRRIISVCTAGTRNSSARASNTSSKPQLESSILSARMNRPRQRPESGHYVLPELIPARLKRRRDDTTQPSLSPACRGR